jgi:O6-methylguanine-DNA--protein-cysteine methyltransferase
MHHGSDPVAGLVACHRVIGADGSLTGYGGGLWRKQWLLDHERANLARADEVARVPATA